MFESHLFKNPVVKGTFILTFAGVITRLIGFCYRIFLSNLIGAKQLGIYQLIFPVYILAISFCCQGMETALTKFISSLCCLGQHKRMKQGFYITLAVTLCLSLASAVCIYIYATPIAVYYIRNEETISCIRVICWGLPFVAIKSSIHGYVLGLKRSEILALSQLVEQIFRVAGTYIAAISIMTDQSLSALIAAYGIVAGEIFSCVYSCIGIRRHLKGLSSDCSPNEPKKVKASVFSVLLKDGFLLTGNRVLTTSLSSMEAVLIPSMLTVYYNDSDYCLTLFGVLTGMAMPFIMLPSTLTNSLSSMLMPAVSESHATNKEDRLRIMTMESLHFCTVIGIFSTVLFIIFGQELGVIVFGNEMAGTFIFMMAFLCPFIYISSTLSSILNGLNLTGLNLFFHLLSIAIRICFTLFIVPSVGIRGYMWGLLVSYLVLTMLLLATLSRQIPMSFDCLKSILMPAIIATITGSILYLAYIYIIELTAWPKLLWLGIVIGLFGLFYFSVTLLRDYVIS